MHIDGSSVNSDPVNPYTAAAERAVEARQPSQERKKPVKRGAGAKPWTGSKQSMMIGQWMHAGKGELSACASGKDIDIGKAAA